MKTLIYLCGVVGGALALSGLNAAEPYVETDPVTGMVIAENWELVRNNCIVCHSSKQFLRQRGTRRNWASTIHWMQKEQGLWKFDPATEDKILTYLAENYAPGEASRRPNLATVLLPPNPYVSALKAEFEDKRAKGLVPIKPEEK